jgi:hypothetical protein
MELLRLLMAGETLSGMVPGNWGVTAVPHVEWLYVAVTENYASPEALANGPVVNDTVTGTAR